MKRGPWSARDEASLRELYPISPTRDVARILKRSWSSVKNRAASLRLRKEVGRRLWTAADDALLRKVYPNTESRAIARQMKRGLSAIYGRVNTLGLEKDAAFIRETGRKNAQHPKARQHQFPRGHVPANKGVKHGKGWGPGRMKATQFKKGQAGWNWKPIGAERLVDGYRYTKVSDIRNVPWTRNWRPTHVLRWETRRGPVPRGRLVAFKNGDRNDVRLKNLELRTLRENMLRNTVHNLPKPIVRAIQLLGALHRKINRRTREEQDRRSA